MNFVKRKKQMSKIFNDVLHFWIRNSKMSTVLVCEPLSGGTSVCLVQEPII